MLRVCGVTFDHTTNYGSCLQAYALQTAIEKLTVDGEPCRYDLLPLSLCLKQGNAINKSFRQRVFGLLNFRRKVRFSGFEKKHMHYADCISVKKLDSLNDIYDAFVCGSDVIWNFSYTNANEVYFLNFAKKHKFSYAASFGKADIHYEFNTIQLKEKPEDIYSRNISKLDGVSVREKNAVEIASRFTDREVVQVCDPVLLLSEDDWRSICNHSTRKGPYIFAYNTHVKPNFTNFLRKIARETGLPVVHVTWRIQDEFNQKAFSFPSPDSWLGLLKDSEYVVTNSFHATAFAAIFHKKFFTVMQDGREARTNIRIYDYLERLGLQDRIVSDPQLPICFDAPDFTMADKVRETERQAAISYLQQNLMLAKQKRELKLI